MKFKLFLKSEKGVFILVTIFVLLVYLFHLFKSKYHQQMMKSSKISFAILDGNRSSNRADDEIDFHFRDSNNKVVYITNFTHEFDCSNAKKGDSITIKYSLINSDYVELIHCYWDSKFLNKKY